LRQEIEAARARQGHNSELADAARYAREKLALYKAKAYGPKMTSPAKLRELQRASEMAELRLERAQAVAPPEADEAEPEETDAAEQTTAADPPAEQPRWGSA
jgi:hypothetical protein